MIDAEALNDLTYMVHQRKRLAEAARRNYEGLGGIKLRDVLELENSYLLALQTLIMAQRP